MSLALGIPQHRFPFPFLAVCPLLFFSVFGDCQIPRQHPAAFVVDKFFPSASSSHCLLLTNTVVGRSFTYSMFSFHNSPRFIPTSIGKRADPNSVRPGTRPIGRYTGRV